jgi:copper transport protein
MDRIVKRFPFAFLFLILLLGFLSIGVVLAHQVVPTKSSPAEGEILSTSPTEVRLTFTEELLEKGSTLQVVDEQGKQVDQGNGGVDLYDPEHRMLIADLSNLPDGIYLVMWKVTLLDADVSTGQYYFGVGNVILPTATVPVSTPVSTTGSNSLVLLWTIVGAISLLLFVLGVYFVRRIRS